jgi:hypothetical protein
VTIEELFVTEVLRQGGLRPSVRADGRFDVEVAGARCAVSLENVARSVDRDGTEVMVRFVANVLSGLGPLPVWEEAESGVHLSLEPNDSDFGDAIHVHVTERLDRVLCHADADERRVTWLTSGDLEGWGISTPEAESVAFRNLDRVLDAASVEISEKGGVRVGMVPTNSPFKASLVLAPRLRELLAATLGWPVFAIVPARDFLMMFAERSLVPRFGPVVVNEFRSSAYALSTEVLELSDDGIRAIGRFDA